MIIPWKRLEFILLDHLLYVLVCTVIERKLYIANNDHIIYNEQGHGKSEKHEKHEKHENCLCDNKCNKEKRMWDQDQSRGETCATHPESSI